jgi:hypothetical protein
MFVKRAAKLTLANNLEEAKTIEFQIKGCKEGQVSLVKKDIQPPPIRGLLLTRPTGKQTKQGPEKGNGDIEDLQCMVKKLSNDIIDMKRNEEEGNQGQRPYKPFFKINLPIKTIEPPHLGNVASDSLCTYHQENHSERDFPQWVHAMNLMANSFLYEVSLTEQPSHLVMNVVDHEEIDPPKDTTMLIWDPDLIMPYDDLLQVQEPPIEVSVVKTRSKGPPVSKYLATTQTLGGKIAPDHLKASFSPRRNPINIHTRESPKMDYNIVEYLKKLKAKILVIDIYRIPQQKDFPSHALKSVENPRKNTH